MNAECIKNNIIQLNQSINPSIDVILIGSGIMSVTLGMILTILEPDWKIHIYERLDKPTQESSNSWNNAGTGHAAYCELNYTPYDEINDTVNITKAISISTAFEVSLQFWSYLTQKKILKNVSSFINNIPHISFVHGEKNVSFLKKRFQTLKENSFFKSMIYSENHQQIKSWIPLVMQGRNKNQKVAVTYMDMGTDINFEEIARQLLTQLKKNPNFKIYFKHDVTCIQSYNKNIWQIYITVDQIKKKKKIYAQHVFIGGGGKSLNLLQSARIKEIQGYAGFPVGGQFLISYNSKIISQHFAKVYGMAQLNMPPMSAPHIDTRILNGDKVLLFGPFATFSSKFLKYGSWLDLFCSLNKSNLIPILQSGIDNSTLIKYLIKQLIMSHNDRINALKEFYPNANSKDWSLIQAGQRVQIIKKNHKNRGVLQFGTEIVSSNNGSLSALLGASPGASTSVSIAIQLLHVMFQKKIHNTSWKNKLIEMIPSYSENIHQNHFNITNQIRRNSREILELNYIENNNN